MGETEAVAGSVSPDSHFYENLPSFDEFSEVANPDRYKPLPGDWQVVVADIQGSTQAIEAGRYKDVNMIGAACITSVLNVTEPHQVPYVFGGDGASMAVPPEAVAKASEALLKTRRLAKEAFGLDLRVGFVPVADIRERSVDVRVAKFRLSPGNHLAMFSGGGVGLADSLVKGQVGDGAYQLVDKGEGEEPDLSGLSCRWEPLEATRGVMLSVLVKAQSTEEEVSAAEYRRVIDGLRDILGYDPREATPVRQENMRFRWPPRELVMEARTTRGKTGFLRRFLALGLESLIQAFLQMVGGRAGGFDAPRYQEELRQNSDFRRFDDTLRLVLDCSNEEVTTISGFLAGRHAEGGIVYGLHQASEALMTCLVFSLEESEHVHFIDGANGGFTLASREMKQQIAALAPKE